MHDVQLKVCKTLISVKVITECKLPLFFDHARIHEKKCDVKANRQQTIVN